MPLTEEERKELADILCGALQDLVSTVEGPQYDDFNESEERWVAAFRRQHYEENGIDWKSLGL